MNLVKTHNDMMALIKETAMGADVKFEKILGAPGEDTSGMKRYYISLPNNVGPEACHIYSLPCDPELIQKVVVDTLKQLSN